MKSTIAEEISEFAFAWIRMKKGEHIREKGVKQQNRKSKFLFIWFFKRLKKKSEKTISFTYFFGGGGTEGFSASRFNLKGRRHSFDT
jgi:hypothetical protein